MITELLYYDLAICLVKVRFWFNFHVFNSLAIAMNYYDEF